jgi:hypothetical protein
MAMIVQKRILITAGMVYGKLDANKTITNRIRGIWASLFARWLRDRGHAVTLLVADMQKEAINQILWDAQTPKFGSPPRNPTPNLKGSLNIRTHNGFNDYQEQCLMFAKIHDAAVLAGAVVNWIPAEPFEGKMPTKGYKPGDILNVPFVLAPRVIDKMRLENPKLTLIGCKMTVGADLSMMINAAYETLINAKCHAVVANDMQNGLRKKTVLYPDQAAFDFDVGSDEGECFYQHLEAIILDEHYTTVGIPPLEACRKEVPNWTGPSYQEAEALFDLIADKYRDRFVLKTSSSPYAFGAIAVRTSTGALCTIREKGQLFTSDSSVDVLWDSLSDPMSRIVKVIQYERMVGTPAPLEKATMNAVLLLRHLAMFPKAAAVLHLHEQLENVPTMIYAPPGTVRDNLREIPGAGYNIEEHGCIVALDQYGEFYKA